ncbi:MAG: hypothetical protein ETSY1_11810 [Candidatus Entotheonella factor]|uniref:Uncharacterized protein n=1 Tax=Entotheonella factor TaxID=1429438 RepID=W4LSB1_ENTF1|nr:MAG: hypothetical protein ETSY1_11810 [Candidatus Entotheonella factor]
MKWKFGVINIFILGLSSIVILGFLYAKSTAVDLNSHYTITNILQSLRELDTRWNEKVLESRLRLSLKALPAEKLKIESEKLLKLQAHLKNALMATAESGPQDWPSSLEPNTNRIESLPARLPNMTPDQSLSQAYRNLQYAQQYKAELTNDFNSRNKKLLVALSDLPDATRDLLTQVASYGIPSG